MSKYVICRGFEDMSRLEYSVGCQVDEYAMNGGVEVVRGVCEVEGAAVNQRCAAKPSEERATEGVS